MVVWNSHVDFFVCAFMSLQTCLFHI